MPRAVFSLNFSDVARHWRSGSLSLACLPQDDFSAD
jgi:hypothetical protein